MGVEVALAQAAVEQIEHEVITETCEGGVVAGAFVAEGFGGKSGSLGPRSVTTPDRARASARDFLERARVALGAVAHRTGPREKFCPALPRSGYDARLTVHPGPGAMSATRGLYTGAAGSFGGPSHGRTPTIGNRISRQQGR
jgi:hypothetical protein